MNNEQIVNLRQFAVFGLFLAAIVTLLFYVYWQQTKAIAAMFKGTIVALLVALGIIDDTDNNNTPTT
jgi:uncharacterized membrane protein